MRVLRSSAFVAAFVTLVTLVLAYGFTPGVERAVGEQDAILFRNFHDMETFGGAPCRWSKGGNRRDERASVIVVPQVGRGDGGVLELLVHTPEDRPAVPLSLSAGGRTLAVADVQGRRTVSVTVPRAAERPFSSGLASVVALAFLVAYGNQWTFHDGSPRPGLTALGLSREFYGLGLLWAAVAVSARSRAPSGSRPPRLEAPA